MTTDLQSATKADLLDELDQARTLVARIECELRRRNDLSNRALHTFLYCNEHRCYEPSTTGEKP